MSNIKKLMMSAAGGGEVLNVEDVFSTYLYNGTGTNLGIDNGIALADGVGGGTSTQFSGEIGNNLRRTSDFSGNSDSTTFTFSAWVLLAEGGTQKIIYSADDGIYGFYVDVQSSNLISISGYQGQYSQRLGAYQSGAQLPIGSWFHLLISIDLSSTSNRYIYINDVDKTSSFTFTQYSYDPIEFTRPNHNIGQRNINEATFKGNLAHVYLDYTYRNLSTTSNRRLFIDADGGSTTPSTLSALNPIMYLPMTEDYAIGKNLGTGGDLTANGPPTIINKGTEYLSNHGHGGIVWFKNRIITEGHIIYRNDNGTPRLLRPYNTAAEVTPSDSISGYGLTQFNSNGFNLGANYAGENGTSSGSRYASWTFRKAPKFFDVVTWTGDAVVGREIPHNLGSVPGCIMIKQTTGTNNWIVYHRGANGGTNPEQYHLYLNLTNPQEDFILFDDTAPTATNFTVGGYASVNGSGHNYVAYVFAHNDGDGEFGPDGDQDIIKCGSYLNDNQAPVYVDLGWEPQWVLVRNITDASPWTMQDNMRGLVAYENDNRTKKLEANATAVETDIRAIQPTATGFYVQNSIDGAYNSGNTAGTRTHIYVAIRRGPMAVPESATDVFDVANNGTTDPKWESGFPVDMGWELGSSAPYMTDKLRSTRLLPMFSTGSEVNNNANVFDYMNGMYSGLSYAPNKAHMWRRAPGFFDIVPYTGNNTAGRTVSHNLGVAPEMMWVKRRNAAADWAVYHSGLGNTKYLILNKRNSAGTSSLWWNNTSPTATEITLGNSGQVNGTSNYDYIAYLFASLPGISKVGSYTGNGTSQTIDCGFTNGARFVMTKRTNDTGDWNVWDTERGIVAGNDPRIELNDQYGTIDSGHDYIDPDNSGFIVNFVADDDDDTNVNGDEYIFYAIA